MSNPISQLADASPINTLREYIDETYNSISTIIVSFDRDNPEHRQKLAFYSTLAVASVGTATLLYQHHFIHEKKQNPFQRNERGFVNCLGYGSNMSPANLTMKGMGEIESARRGIVRDWYLNFGMYVSSRINPAYASANPKQGATLHGVVLELTMEQMIRMDSLEGPYDAVLVDVELYPEDGGGILQAYVFTFSDEIRSRAISKGTPPNRLPLFNPSAKPGYNYLSTLVCGATTMKLRPSYIRQLQRLECVDFPCFTADLIDQIPQREFTMEEIKASMNEGATGPVLYTCCGVVFEMNLPRSHNWTKWSGGADTTIRMGRRYAYANDTNCASLDAFECEQKQYVLSECAALIMGPSEEYPPESVSKVNNVVGRCQLEKYMSHESGWACNPHFIKYFGFGSNLRPKSLEMKGMGKIHGWKRATLKDYELTFSCGSNSYTEPGYGNVEFKEGEEVHGVLYDFTLEQIRRMDQMELSYNRIRAPIHIYEEDGGGIEYGCVYTISMDFFDATQADPDYPAGEQALYRPGTRPGRNYLDTIIVGAETVGLRDEWIQKLQGMQSVPFVQLTPELIAQVPNREFTLEEVEGSIENKNNSCLLIVRGIVIELQTSWETFRKMLGGKDSTSFFAKRWAFCDENDSCDDPHAFSQEHKAYLNSMVASILMGKPEQSDNDPMTFVPVGTFRLEDYVNF